jgi:beta-lactamase regulating signal transducer with metallopeptidase domain
METLLHAVLSNAVVAAVLAVVITILGRISRRPALVHSLWLLVLLKLLTPPIWPISLSWLARSEADQVVSGPVALQRELTAESAATVTRTTSLEEPADGAPQEIALPTATSATLLSPVLPLPESPPAARPAALLELANPAPKAVSSPISWRSWLVAIWLSGSLLWLTLAGSRLYRFGRLLRLTQRAPAEMEDVARRLAKRMGLGRCPDVSVVPAPISPLLWALAGKPRLLLPASLLKRLSPEQWYTLLAHELAHLCRKDHWVRILELAVFALYWWHPVVWWARRELREAEEQCCDAWVIWALPGAAEAYATALVEAVTYLSGARSVLPLAASGIGQMHLLKRRLTMIMRGTTPKGLSAAGSLAVLGLAAVLLPLYPTWARTEQRPAGGGDQPTSGATATTAGRAEDGDDELAPSQSRGAPGTPWVGAVGGVHAGPSSGSYSAIRGIDQAKAYSETVEDAQDEVELLRVQLDLRRAERREVEARLKSASSALQRMAQLQASGAVDLSLVENARTEVAVQEARLAAKHAQIKEAELRLKQAERRLARLRGNAPRSRETPGGGRYGPAGMNRPSSGAIVRGVGQGPGGTPGMPGPTSSGVPGQPGVVGSTSPGMPSVGSLNSMGTGFGGGFTGTGSFSGAIGGGLTGGIGVMAPIGGVGIGAPAYEHRLAEVERKLQTLVDEVKALRKQKRAEEKPSGKAP